MARKSTALLLVFVLLGQSQLAFSELQFVTAKLRTMPEQRSFDGRIEAIHQATVSAQTSGRIEDINVDIGDFVVAGTVILTIVNTEQRAGLTQAEANVAEAKSNLVAEMFEFQRIKNLFASDFVAKTEMDKANARLSVAKAKVSNAQAAIKTAKEELSHTAVKAPFDGIVRARLVEPGELVQPGTLLLSGYDPIALRVEVDLPQSIAKKVRKLDLASIVRNAENILTNGITPSKLILYPSADPATNTVRARLELSQVLSEQALSKQDLIAPDSYEFRPGEFVKVLFTVGETQRLLIPLSSVVYRSEVTAIYILQQGKPVLRQIRPGAIYAH
ncbi:efflux RND transporter periplasmic adaptor subunit [Alteromonas facilis]|uniref:efflux RND transporter periplasmic adaptor subunit n=1 Tax=Alteromonas facilis TaxID=2048004 RepID=UPI000C284B95|nr:efflux RND transporter periplasmic adaptor subunit [Alteromonas facilis]